MKNSLFFLVLCALFMIANQTQAQLEVGQIQLSGFAQFGSSSIVGTANDNKTTSVSIVPRIARMYTERTAVGLQLIGQYSNNTYTFVNNSVTTTQEWKNLAFGGGLFMMSYFPISERIYFHLNSNLLYTNHTVTSNYTYTPTSTLYPDMTSEVVSNKIAFFSQPGFSFFLNKRWALQTNFGYLGYEYEVDENDVTTSDLRISWNSLQFGTMVTF